MKALRWAAGLTPVAFQGRLKSSGRCNSAKDAVRLLDETLKQEKKTDESLTTLADGVVNAAAGI